MLRGAKSRGAELTGSSAGRSQKQGVGVSPGDSRHHPVRASSPGGDWQAACAPAPSRPTPRGPASRRGGAGYIYRCSAGLGARGLSRHRCRPVCSRSLDRRAAFAGLTARRSSARTARGPGWLSAGRPRGHCCPGSWWPCWWPWWVKGPPHPTARGQPNWGAAGMAWWPARWRACQWPRNPRRRRSAAAQGTTCWASKDCGGSTATWASDSTCRCCPTAASAACTQTPATVSVGRAGRVGTRAADPGTVPAQAPSLRTRGPGAYRQPGPASRLRKPGLPVPQIPAPSPVRTHGSPGQVPRLRPALGTTCS